MSAFAMTPAFSTVIPSIIILKKDGGIINERIFLSSGQRLGRGCHPLL